MKYVENYMQKDIVTFSPHDSLYDIANIFQEKDISLSPVINGNNIVGIISISDIIKFLELKLPKTEEIIKDSHSILFTIIAFLRNKINMNIEMKKILNSMVMDFMNKDIVSIEPNKTLFEASDIMEKNNISKLLVIENEKLKGIISQKNILKAMLE